jgi:hypothetical protein
MGSYAENYGTNMFYEINPSADSNGHVTFVTRSLCCAAALGAIRLERAVAASGVGAYVAGAAGAGVAVAALAGATKLLPAYAAYASALTCLQFVTCVLYAQCAHGLDDAAAAEAAAAVGEVDGGGSGDDAAPSRAACAAGAPRGRAAVLFGANATAALALASFVQAVAERARAPPRTQFGLLSACVRLRHLPSALARACVHALALPKHTHAYAAAFCRCRYCFVVAGVTAAAGAALRARLGIWRLVHVRPPGGGAAGEEGAGEEGEEERQTREMAPLLGSE